MIFLLRANVSSSESAREEIVGCLLAALDTVKHEEAFNQDSNDLSAYQVDIHAPDSRIVGRMTLIDRGERPEPIETEDDEDESW